MSRYNTGAPVPSNQVKDFSDNAQIVDEIVHLQQPSTLDRFGNPLKTWFGIQQDANSAILAFGYITMDSFQAGNTLTLPNQVLRDTETGEYYRWDGAFPKTVAAGSTPATSGGIGIGAWLSVGDAALRSELSGDEGYKLIPSVQIQNWKDIGDIRGWGAVEGEDCTDALQSAINDRGALDWGASSDVIINGNYQINGKVYLTTDVRLIGNWATITSISNDWIIVSAYKDANGEIVNNFDGLTDAQVISDARLKGVQVKGITFVGVSKILKLQAFTERCIIEDVSFQNCGIAWDARLSFYPQFKNIIIRGAKSGYENSYAYQFRHQCNEVYLEKVTVVGRKYGELIDDDRSPTTPGVIKNCQNIHKKQCTYEQLTSGVKVNITTYGYKDEGWYAEGVSDNLYIFDNGDHYDTIISNPAWCLDVEKQGIFNNLKGRSEVYQSTQYNYTPPKRSAIQFVGSVVLVHPAIGLGEYKTIGASDFGLAWNSTSKVTFDSVTFTQDGVPVNATQTNLVNIPVNISGFVPLITGKAIGVTGSSYSVGANALSMSTDIFWSRNNLILVAIRIYQTSLPSNSHSATAILMNGFKTQLAGQPVSYEQDGDTTIIRVGNPAEGGDTSWLSNGDYSIEGCIRLL